MKQWLQIEHQDLLVQLPHSLVSVLLRSNLSELLEAMVVPTVWYGVPKEGIVRGS